MSEAAKWLSPAGAAARAGVSRGTIQNAIKAQQLRAIRNNRNQWQIAEEALSAWLSGRASVVSISTDIDMPLPAKADAEELLAVRLENAELNGKLHAQERLIQRLEAELEHARKPLWRRLLG